jgi:hypothetical protein
VRPRWPQAPQVFRPLDHEHLLCWRSRFTLSALPLSDARCRSPAALVPSLLGCFGVRVLLKYRILNCVVWRVRSDPPRPHRCWWRTHAQPLPPRPRLRQCAHRFIAPCTPPSKPPAPAATEREVPLFSHTSVTGVSPRVLCVLPPSSPHSMLRARALAHTHSDTDNRFLPSRASCVCAHHDTCPQSSRLRPLSTARASDASLTLAVPHPCPFGRALI